VSASPLTLLRRNAALLMMSFINAGVTTLLPQRYFARTVPGTKQFWLSTTLLLGTLGAIVGVSLARRVRVRPPGGLLTLLLVAVLLLWAGTRGEILALYVALHVAVRGMSNFTTQELDERAALVAGEADRTANDRIGTLLRFAGMLLGPLCFGLVPSEGWPFTIELLVLTGLAMLSSRELRVAAAPPPPPKVTSPLAFHDRLLVLSGAAIYGTYYLLGSNMFYVLTDLHHLPNATARAGVLITTVFGGAVLTTIASGLLRRGAFGLRWMLFAPSCMALASLGLHTPLATSMPVAVGVSLLLGAGLSFFLLAFRNYASRAAQAGAEQWLAVFNNLGNTSALLGYGVMALMAGVARWSGLADGTLLVAGLIGLSAMGFVLAVFAGRGPASVPVQAELAR
jgi:hypothetical protein